MNFSIGIGRGLVERLIRQFVRRRLVIANYQDLAMERFAMPTAGTWDIFTREFTNTSGKTITRLAFKASGFHRQTGGPVEYPLGNDHQEIVTFRVGNGRIRTVRWGGSTIANVLNGTVLESDTTVDVVIPPGGKFRVFTGYSVKVNGHFRPNGASTQGLTTGFGKGTGDGHLMAQANPNAMFEDGAGIASTNEHRWGGVAMPISDEGTVAWGLLSDSNGAGESDAGAGPRAGGYGARGADLAGVPFVRLAYSGDRATFVNSYTGRPGRGDYWRNVTKLTIALGTNDIMAGKSLAEIKAAVLAVAKAAVLDGVEVGVATVLPLGDSTKLFEDMVSQSPASAGFETVRKGLNAWYRSPTGFRADLLAAIPTAKIGPTLDICAAIETNPGGVLTQDGGYVLPGGPALKTGTFTAVSTYTLTDANLTGVADNQYRGKYVIPITGAAAYKAFAIRDHTGTGGGVFSSYTGISVTPAIGDTYIIGDPYKDGYLHATTRAQIAIAASIAPVIVGWVLS
ncbi:MAG: hypothetical protein EON58_01095 [Alphaproteobacteria bacterium]|nr:MAG: hypothetical protein EON58_01095 [Alphaproteobacteria bacterium]